MDIRWQQRFPNFKKALAKMAEVVENREDDLSGLETEGLIHRFEYTFELAWKTLQDLLKHKGYQGVLGPNPVLEQAFQDGYFTDGAGWREMNKSRNLTSHTYNSETAEGIATNIRNSFYYLLKDLAFRLEEEISDCQQNIFNE